MQNRNPYASPRAKVKDVEGAQEYGEVRILSAQGRIGRVRYIGYTFGLSLLIMIVLGAVVGVMGVQSGAGVAALAVGYIAMFVVQIMLTIQRSHDFNTSGWLSVLMFVPLVGLIFWFIPGTPGENNYGPPPPPNSAGVIVLACVVPIVAVVGILAAIAIPAYQEYAQRAQQAQLEQPR